MFQLSLDLYYTEDEIYELSYAKEPKNPKVQVSRAEVKLFVTVHRFTLTLTSSYKRVDICTLSVGVTCSSKQKQRRSA